MNIKTRRLILILFIIFFIILAPLVILYTIGYRYDFKRNKLLQTGGIFLYVKNPGASIFLNGQFYKKSGIFSDEIRINKLLPNKYSLRVEKEGYFPWEKTLEVKSGQTTFAEHLILFKKSNPQKIISGQTRLLGFSPDKQFLSYLVKNQELSELWLFNRNTGEKNLLRRSAKIDNLWRDDIIKWSPDSKKIILSWGDDKNKNFFLADINNPSKTTPLKELTNISFNKLIWSPRNNNFIYGADTRAIYRLDLTGGLSIKLSEPRGPAASYPLNDLIIKENNFYYTKLTPQNTLLIKKDINSGEEKAILKLEPKKYYLRNGGPDNLIIFFDKQEEKFILINLDGPTIMLSGSAKNFHWSDNKKRLLYYNDFEIWFYDITKRKNELVTRYSQEIKKAGWLPGFDYIAFILDNALNIIELDGRDKRNFYQYTPEQNINQFVINEAEINIYLRGTIGGNPGLYLLNIQ